MRLLIPLALTLGTCWLSAPASAQDMEEEANRRMKLSFDLDEVEGMLAEPEPEPKAEPKAEPKPKVEPKPKAEPRVESEPRGFDGFMSKGNDLRRSSPEKAVTYYLQALDQKPSHPEVNYLN